MFVGSMKIPSANASTSTNLVFGYSVVGSVEKANISPIWLVGCQYVLSQSGTLSSISVYTGAYCAGTKYLTSMVAAVYADNSGSPSSLVAESAPVVLSFTPGWVTFSVSASLSAGTYWLAVTSNNTYNLFYDVGSVGQCQVDVGVSYPTLPVSFDSTWWAFFDGELSIYATYAT
jgi:hypothetical protein